MVRGERGGQILLDVAFHKGIKHFGEVELGALIIE